MGHEQHPEITSHRVTIRRLREDDRAAIERLSQLDSHSAPKGAMLGAEVEGNLLAAISLASGEVIADPFSRTGELRALLELRFAQLRRREGRGRRLVSALQSRRRPPALAGSPPGAINGTLAFQRRPL
jgi:hypothetical protein